MTTDLSSPSAAITLPSLPSRPSHVVEPFQFTGTGAEYFRIWIVNIALTVLTFGIYSAWAKVRKTRYFYEHTRLDGSSFEYHGSPIAILKGRAVVLGFFVVYQLAFYYSPVAALAIGLAMMILMPFLLWKSLQFKLHNASYRGVRFRFGGHWKQAYFVFLLWPALAGLSYGLLGPLAYQRLKRFQHGQSSYGTTGFSFSGTVKEFYKFHAKWMLIGAPLAVATVIALIWFLFNLQTVIDKPAGSATGWWILFLAAAAALTAITLSFSLLIIQLQNLVWNHTKLGPHRFRNRVKFGKTLAIMLTNHLGIILTFGLFTPFAQIRMLKYRIESMQLQPASSLDEFVAAEAASISAVGEGLADFLDIDIAL